MSNNNPFNLQPDVTEEVTISNGKLNFIFRPNNSALLKLTLNSKNFRSWFKEPYIKVQTAEGDHRIQYLPPKIHNSVYIDLSWIRANRTELTLESIGATFASEAQMLYFAFNDPIEMGTTLVIAPHPDDGELCCTSFYRPNTYLVTLSAGEKVKELKKQYYTNMDNSIEQASLRKGILRAYNSVTTPMLGDIRQDRMVNLGYFDATLAEMNKSRDQVIKTNHSHSISTFRKFNPQPNFAELTADPENKYSNLIADLTSVIKTVNPDRIVVTNPYLDTHLDHMAAGQMLLELLDLIPNNVRYVYLYSIHIKREKPIFFGPALNQVGMPYIPTVRIPETCRLKYRSFDLSEEQQKVKTIMANMMFDTYKFKDHRYQKCPYTDYINSPKIGKAYYFQRFVKQNEVFLVIER